MKNKKKAHRTEISPIRFTKDEARAVKKRAKKAGMSKSEWIRNCIYFQIARYEMSNAF